MRLTFEVISVVENHSDKESSEKQNPQNPGHHGEHTEGFDEEITAGLKHLVGAKEERKGQKDCEN